MSELLDSGATRVFSGGAQRDCNKNKGRCDLLPPLALLTVSKHFQKGAEKYGENNWRKGMPQSAFLDSGIRHMLKASAGQTDEDHLAAAAWNILCAIETREIAAQKALMKEAVDSFPPETEGSWIEVIINGSRQRLSASKGERLCSYAEICRYAGKDVLTRPKVVFRIPAKNTSGELYPGGHIVLNDETCLNVAETAAA